MIMYISIELEFDDSDKAKADALATKLAEVLEVSEISFDMQVSDGD